MNRAASMEMLHCGGGADVSVLERQQARMKWQQEQIQQQQQSFFNGNELSVFSTTSAAAQVQQFTDMIGGYSSLDDLISRAVKPDPGMENGWPDFDKFDGDDQLGYGACGYGNVPGFEMNQALFRMASCPPEAVADSKVNQTVLQGSLSFKKRKADKTQSLKVTEEDETKEKRMKGCGEEGDLKITQQYSHSNNREIRNTNENNNKNRKSINNGESSTDTSSKEKSKVTEVQKPDVIHVRARRGQATDSHSLAERVRREKISERMKYLQDLVPGCNKITGKAGMLDEIINYVQSLQRQVEFLSMKLAAVNPRLDFNIDNFFTKQMFPSSSTNFSTAEVSSDMANPAYFQLNQLQQVISCCGLEMGINPPDMGLRRTISAPVSIPETFIDSSCFNQIQSTWDPELQNLYGMEFQQGRSLAFPSQQFTGSTEGGNLKMEM